MTSPLFFVVLGLIWLLVGIAYLGLPFIVSGISIIAVGLLFRRLDKRAARGELGDPTTLSPKHRIPSTVRVLCGVLLCAFGIIFSAVLYSMGGGIFALLGLLFVLAGMLQLRTGLIDRDKSHTSRS